MNRHILLIDDDKYELNRFKAALKEIKGRFKCSYAATSEQALEMLGDLKPDIIFIGYNMSTRIRGLQLLSIVRNEPNLQRAKVFIYIETYDEGAGKMARMLGAAGCMEKDGTTSWLTHQFKAIFAGKLIPEFSILRKPFQLTVLKFNSYTSPGNSTITNSK